MPKQKILTAEVVEEFLDSVPMGEFILPSHIREFLQDYYPKEAPACFESFIPDRLATDDFLTAWEQWVKYRKEKKKPITEMTAGRQLLYLNTFTPENAIQILDNSITNGWVGLFPLSVGKNDTAKAAKWETMLSGKPIIFNLN